MKHKKNYAIIAFVIGSMTVSAPAAKAGFMDWLGCAIQAGFSYLGCGAERIAGNVECAVENIDFQWDGFIPSIGVDNAAYKECVTAPEGPKADWAECTKNASDDFTNCKE